jgi:hypothetical protein
MNILNILIEAQKAVDEAKVAEDLRSAAFQKAVEMLSGQVTPIPVRGGPALLRTGAPTTVTAGDEALVAKIARKLTISTDTIAEVYSSGADGALEVVVGVGKLDGKTAAATKQLALLVTGGRQLAEIEEWTKTKIIRHVCIHYGRFDQPNFAKTLKQMDEAFSFKGKGQQLELRIHQRGIERLKQLIASLTGT